MSEELIEKWKQLGFVYEEDESVLGEKGITLNNVKKHYSIFINLITKEFGTYYDADFTLEEHKLLNETFKELGWL